MRKVVLVLGVATLLAGCGHGGATVAASKLPSLVLQPGDLPSAFERFDVGRLAKLDARPGPRRDPSRFGRLGGWKARYRRPGSTTTPGPLVVESRADLFKNDNGAKHDLDAYAGEFDASFPGARRLNVSLGDGTRAVTFVEGHVRFYAIAWRDANVTGSVLVNGFDGRLHLADALALASRQERRIARAS